MIVLDNYTTIDEKILLDPNTFNVSIVDDSYEEEPVGVGGFVNEVFLGVFTKNDLLHFCYNGKIYSANSDTIICKNNTDGKDNRHFIFSISGNVICDIRYERSLSPIPAFGDDEEEFDFLLYLGNLLESKNSIDKFVSSAA